MSEQDPKPHRYVARRNGYNGTPTDTEHDEWVEEHGCPYTHNWMRHLDPPRRPAKKED